METGRREKSEDERPIDKDDMSFSDWKEVEKSAQGRPVRATPCQVFSEYRNSSTEMVVFDQQLRAMEGYIHKSDGDGRCKV